MKLLFDSNLSPKLVLSLKSLFPGSVHLFDLALPRTAADSSIWTYAKNNGFDIITTDADSYPPFVTRYGPPPKVILLESWQYPTMVTSNLIRGNLIPISDFGKSNQGLLILRA